MKTIWVVLITLVATAVIVGGGSYYFLNKKATNDKNSLQSQIDDLNAKLATAEKSLADSQVSSVATTTPSVGSAATGSSNASVSSADASCDSTLVLSNLKNATYAISGNLATDSFKMTNGNYTKGAITATLVTSYYACDSANNKSVATIFKYNDGGTGWIYYLETMSPLRSGQTLVPAMTALTTLGDRVVIKSLTYTNGLITVNMLTQGPSDSAADPTLDTTVRYKLPTSGVNLIKQ